MSDGFLMTCHRVTTFDIVPVEIRRKLMLREGDKILFIERDNGEIVIDSASSMAILKAQKAFENMARTADMKNEDEVQALVDNVRYRKGSADPQCRDSQGLTSW